VVVLDQRVQALVCAVHAIAVTQAAVCMYGYAADHNAPATKMLASAMDVLPREKRHIIGCEMRNRVHVGPHRVPLHDPYPARVNACVLSCMVGCNAAQ
jgi:hypothetical protein